ncbi:MAG: hypothetical protein MOGMAGMI_00394 [Candidatus Omnitrophica bacterium]|nr:hypothetical protein [Candidatus Omnitrophota bacterium]
MPSNLAGLGNNILESVKGIGAELGLVSDPAEIVPSGFEEVISSKNPSGAWNKLPFPYTFSVLDLESRTSNTPFKDFSLPLPPTAITQTEDPSISIKPTQGGTVVSHSGMRYKTLTISGTTGVSPFRGVTGVDSTTGKVIAKPREMKFKSGYEVFQDLRNWFRAYYHYKKINTTNTAKNARLVFKNFKDGEFLIVELLKFTMKRTAERSLLYDYEMEFKVLGNFQFEDAEVGGILGALGSIDNVINKVTSKLDVARGIFASVSDIMRNVESTYNSTVLEPFRKIHLVAKAIAGVGITAGDVSRRIVRNTVTTVKALNTLLVLSKYQEQSKSSGIIQGKERVIKKTLPKNINSVSLPNPVETLLNLNEALFDIPYTDLGKATVDATNAEIAELVNLPKSFYEDVREELLRVKANAEDAFNLGDSAYDDIFDRTATLKAEVGKETTNLEYDILFAFNEALSAINTILSFSEIFKEDNTEKLNKLEELFIDGLNLQTLPAVKQTTLQVGVDLEQLALQELGNAERWVEIASLNNLKAPYITQDISSTQKNVLRPGDSILIPQQIVNNFSPIPEGKEVSINANLTPVEKSLGVDLKVSKDFDLIIAQNGDLSVINSTDNMAQAIILKLQYSKGDLKNHPTLGVGVEIGGKFLSLEEIRDNLIASMKQDNRIESITDVSLLREGSSLFMQFKVNIKKIDTPIPLNIRL